MIHDYGVTDGHELYSLHRFRPDVRHMVIFDDLIDASHHRVRLYLTEEAYQALLHSAEKGFVKLIHQEQIVEGSAEEPGRQRKKHKRKPR